MARRRRGRPVNGILVLNKPRGISSNKALQSAKQLYFAAKAGHTGSLDPLASGVLPLCFGEATKFSQFLLNADKAYESTVVFGTSTATGDAEGEVRAQVDASGLVAADVEAALRDFRGEIEQVPSMYSAIKKDGQPLYKLARQGREVEREARTVVVRRLELTDFRPGAHPQADIYLECTKGTYVRTIAEDLGGALGCGAHISALRRTRSGPFGLDDSVALATLEALKNGDQLAEMDALLRPADAALGAMPLVRLTESGGFTCVRASRYRCQTRPVMVWCASPSKVVNFWGWEKSWTTGAWRRVGW